MPYDQFDEYYPDPVDDPSDWDDYQVDDDFDPTCNCKSCTQKKAALDGGGVKAKHKERTLIVLKPDAVQRGLVGEVIQRFEQTGFHMLASKMMQVNDALLEKHYAQHVGKDFWPSLKAFFESGPVMATVWEGPYVCKKTREIIGPTKHPSNCAPGTIRGTFAIAFPANIVHGSDDPYTAKNEINNFFTKDEISQMDSVSGGYDVAASS